MSVITSCNRINKLSKIDFNWIPYKGNETLVFRSNFGEIDTIFFLKKDTILAYPEAQSFNGISYQVVSIFCKHSDSWPPNGQHRYLENTFLELKKTKNSQTELNILLSARDANFYRLKGIKLDSLNNQKPTVLQTKYNYYTDVYVIYPSNNKEYERR